MIRSGQTVCFAEAASRSLRVVADRGLPVRVVLVGDAIFVF
jgi:hypothetical protein